MTFLPIVARELRVAARRRSTYLGRLAAASVAVLITGWQYLTMSSTPFLRPQLGTMLFGTLATFAFVYCLLAGIRATADCLSEEKREGTLGLLFLTDLKGYDVVLGKLAATSLNTFYNLLAILPLMVIPRILGGVTGETILRTSVLLVNTLLFSLAVGMFASAVSRNERKAMGLAILVIALIAGGLPLLGLWYCDALNLPIRQMPLGFLALSPGFAMSQTAATTADFWVSVGSTHLLTWLLLAGAAAILPHAWHDRPKSARQLQLEQRATDVAFGPAERRSAFRRRLLAINPILWLNARNRMEPVMLWLFLAAGAVIWFACALRWPRQWYEEGVYITTALGAHFVLKVWLAAYAVRRFAEDRRSGALELLLATPLSVPELLRGQTLALRRTFSGPIFVVLLMDAVFAASFLFGTDLQQEWRSRQALLMFWMFVGGMASLVLDAWAIAWLGMWFGLTSRQASRASGAVLWRVIFLPAVVMWFGFTLIGIGSWFFRSNFTGEWMLALWFGLGFLNSALWISFARRRLFGRLREVATQRFDAPRAGVFARMFGGGRADKPPVLAS